MFREDDYLDPEEPSVSVEAVRNGCTWAGSLYQRKTGGFDLFYDHENSDFKPLDVSKITALRHEAERGANFVAHLEPERNRKVLLETAKQCLLDWVITRVG